MQQHDFVLESDSAAREFVNRCVQEHPVDVAFFRSGRWVCIFNGSGRSIEESVERIFQSMSTQGTNPRRTRRISSTGVYAVQDPFKSKASEKP